MSDTIKSTCKNCRASKWVPPGYTCKLDYKIETIRDMAGTMEVYPLEPCPKPLTFDAYFQIKQSKENVERAVKFIVKVKKIVK